jgi:hypothetical protein
MCQVGTRSVLEDTEGSSPLETEQVESSEEIAQGVCKSGLIPSPKAQEG